MSAEPFALADFAGDEISFVMSDSAVHGLSVGATIFDGEADPGIPPSSVVLDPGQVQGLRAWLDALPVEYGGAGARP